MRESKQRVRHFGKLGGSAAACIAALLFGEGALAQAAAPDGGAAREVVVTATRIPTDIEDVGSSVTVITGADIERKQRKMAMKRCFISRNALAISLSPILKCRS